MNAAIIIESLRPLYDIGFALIRLHPKSKAPIGNDWQKGPRLAWPAIAKHKGNVGVRLGGASRVQGHHLVVLDCDVKSESPKHQQEMQEALRRLTGLNVNSWPTVFSGRGNGSKHIYCVSKWPVSTKRLAQSVDEVKVRMPSAKKATARDRAKLTEADIKAGYRIRPAWEISLMGDGSQTVLPPSIHPDSGRVYLWKINPPFSKKLPLLPEALAKKAAMCKVEAGSLHKTFHVKSFDLIGSDLPAETVAAITDGEGVSSDRSAALLSVSNRMLRHGMSEDEILSVLTDRSNFLGAVAYEHAQTNDRQRAGKWVRRFTLEKSKKQTLAQHDFDDEVEIAPLDEDEKADIEKAEADSENDWESKIIRGKGKDGEDGPPKNLLKNVITILQGTAGNDVFRRDEFANADLYSRPGPWGGKAGVEVTDTDTVRIKKWLSDTFRFEPANDKIEQAIVAVSDLNRFHPVRDYLDQLEWDGVPRIDSWLKVYVGAKAREPYLSAVSRKVLVAMVKRIYEPGAKFDEVLILQGNQGAGKSTSLRYLVGDKWFTDAHIDVRDKDAVMTMRSVWLVEMGELSTMNQSDAEHLKQFISRTTDRIRVPFGKRSENFPRQCVFIGTTNKEEFLKDSTGNRRYWPVLVGKCNFHAIERDRDQLFAEAKFAYQMGEPTYLEDEDMAKAARAEQESRAMTDIWEEKIKVWLVEDQEGSNVDKSHLEMGDLFGDFGPLIGEKAGMSEQRRVGDIMRRLGYTKSVVRRNGVQRKTWTKVGVRT